MSSEKCGYEWPTKGVLGLKHVCAFSVDESHPEFHRCNCGVEHTGFKKGYHELQYDEVSSMAPIEDAMLKSLFETQLKPKVPKPAVGFTSTGDVVYKQPDGTYEAQAKVTGTVDSITIGGVKVPLAGSKSVVVGDTLKITDLDAEIYDDEWEDLDAEDEVSPTAPGVEGFSISASAIVGGKISASCEHQLGDCQLCGGTCCTKCGLPKAKVHQEWDKDTFSGSLLSSTFTESVFKSNWLWNTYPYSVSVIDPKSSFVKIASGS